MTRKCGRCGRVVPVRPDMEVTPSSHVDPDGDPCPSTHLPEHYRDAVVAAVNADLWSEIVEAA